MRVRCISTHGLEGRLAGRIEDGRIYTVTGYNGAAMVKLRLPRRPV
jgi:hypothetical protein